MAEVVLLRPSYGRGYDEDLEVGIDPVLVGAVIMTSSLMLEPPLLPVKWRLLQISHAVVVLYMPKEHPVIFNI